MVRFNIIMVKRTLLHYLSNLCAIWNGPNELSKIKEL